MENKEPTLEELMELAELPAQPGDEVEGRMSHIDKFVLTLGIKKGDSVISAKIIYEKYLRYMKSKPIKTSSQFFKEFGQKFMKKRKSEGMYYLLDSEAFDNTEEEKWKARRTHRDRKKRKTLKVERQRKEKEIRESFCETCGFEIPVQQQD